MEEFEGGHATDGVGVEFGESGADGVGGLGADLGIGEVGSKFGEGLFESFDAGVDFVVFADKSFDADDRFGSEVRFGVESSAVGGGLVLSVIAALFECGSDAIGELFADLLELGICAVVELREVCGEVLEQETGFGKSICEHEHANEFESARGVGLEFFDECERGGEELAWDGVERDVEFPIVCGACGGCKQFVDARDGGRHITRLAIAAGNFSTCDSEFIEGGELWEDEGANFASLFGASDWEGLCGPCGDIGYGRIGASGWDVDFAVALINEFEEEFLFDAIDGAAVGGNGSEGGGGGDHAVKYETIFEAD